MNQSGNHAFHKVTKFMRNSSSCNQNLRFKCVCVGGWGGSWGDSKSKINFLKLMFENLLKASVYSFNSVNMAHSPAERALFKSIISIILII